MTDMAGTEDEQYDKYCKYFISTMDDYTKDALFTRALERIPITASAPLVDHSLSTDLPAREFWEAISEVMKLVRAEVDKAASTYASKLCKAD